MSIIPRMDWLSPLFFLPPPCAVQRAYNCEHTTSFDEGGTATQCSSTEGSRATTGNIFPTITEATNSPDGLFISAAFLPHSCAIERAYNCEPPTSFYEGGTATQCSSTEGSRATTGNIFPTITEATNSPDGLFVSAAFLPHSCAVERDYNCEHMTSLDEGGTATQCSFTEGSRATTGNVFPTITEATNSPDGLFVSAAFLPHSCAVQRAYNCMHTTSFDEGGLRHNAHSQKVHELLQATFSQQYRRPLIHRMDCLSPLLFLPHSCAVQRAYNC